MRSSSAILRNLISRNGRLLIPQRTLTKVSRPSAFISSSSSVVNNSKFALRTSQTSPGRIVLGIQQSMGFASMSFEEAVQKSTSMKNPDNMTKLKMYALYKQATKGKATGKRPGAMDFVGRAKFDAWSELGDMSESDAKKEYTELVSSDLGGDSDAPEQTSGSTSASASGAVDGLDVTVADGVRTIRLNRPDKYNALTREMYKGIKDALTEANTDNNTRVIVMTGAGNYYCSGNDLSNFMNVTDPLKMAKDGRDLLCEYVGSYIDCKKPLVAVINGPAVGISVTVLGLFDLVFSSDQATFTSPFSALGQSPEGCASYTFPRIMGYAKASELLFFNQNITAAEAEKIGLVTAVIPRDRLQAETEKRIRDIAELPINSLVYSKELVRGRERDLLHKVNTAECDRLQERWVSEDCMNAIQKFFTRKSKV